MANPSWVGDTICDQNDIVDIFGDDCEDDGGDCVQKCSKIPFAPCKKDGED